MADWPQWLTDLMAQPRWTRDDFLSWALGLDPEANLPNSLVGEWERVRALVNKGRLVRALSTDVTNRDPFASDIDDDDWIADRDALISWAVSLAHKIPKAIFPTAPPTAATRCDVDTRERTSLLIIIAALARHGKLDLAEPTKAAGVIEAEVRALGARLDVRTITTHLMRVPDAIDRKG